MWTRLGGDRERRRESLEKMVSKRVEGTWGERGDSVLRELWVTAFHPDVTLHPPANPSDTTLLQITNA